MLGGEILKIMCFGKCFSLCYPHRLKRGEVSIGCKAYHWTNGRELEGRPEGELREN